MHNYTESQSGMKELWSGQAASEGAAGDAPGEAAQDSWGALCACQAVGNWPWREWGGAPRQILNHMMIYKDLYFRKFLLAAVDLEEEV